MTPRFRASSALKNQSFFCSETWLSLSLVILVVEVMMSYSIVFTLLDSSTLSTISCRVQMAMLDS